MQPRPSRLITATILLALAATTGPTPRADLRKVLDIAGMESTGSGELWVAVRDDLGRRRQITYPLRYADTTSGRYLVTMSESGEVWLLVAPASRHDVAVRLRNLYQEIANPDK
ncbi:ESX secretion-associated protein EspG [Kibdelosporangium lantanae]|uniref:ESX secretion-associated protein EspG n=1 Tax=Kibdelosporangium lantanae TaxID=1497396 RepID=A0ABW3M8N2_9PSEU